MQYFESLIPRQGFLGACKEKAIWGPTSTFADLDVNEWSLNFSCGLSEGQQVRVKVRVMVKGLRLDKNLNQNFLRLSLNYTRVFVPRSRPILCRTETQRVPKFFLVWFYFYQVFNSFWRKLFLFKNLEKGPSVHFVPPLPGSLRSCTVFRFATTVSPLRTASYFII